MNFRGYESDGYFDEMIGEDGKPRSAAKPLAKDIETLPDGELELRQTAAERALIQALSKLLDGLDCRLHFEAKAM